MRVDVLARSRSTLESAEIRDPLCRAARLSLYMALFFNSILVLRVGTLTVGDLFLFVSIVFALIARTLNRRAPRPESQFPLWGTVVLVLAPLVASFHSVYQAVDASNSLSIVARLVLDIVVLPWIARLILWCGIDDSLSRGYRAVIAFASRGGSDAVR